MAQVFTLSLEHNRVGKWNAVYNSDSIRLALMSIPLDRLEGLQVPESSFLGDLLLVASSYG